MSETRAGRGDGRKYPADNAFAATSLNTFVQLVANNLGSTLVPKMALEPLLAQQQELIAVPLAEPGPHRTIAFLVRPNYTRMASIEALRDLVATLLMASSRID